MKKNTLKAGLCVLAILMLCAQLAFAAGSCVFSIARNLAAGGQQDRARQLSWLCTSAVNGTITTPTITGDGYDSSYTGVVRQIMVIPGAVRVPTNLYDVTMYTATVPTDDVLGGLGANLGNATIKIDAPKTATNSMERVIFNETLTPSAANMGNATTCTIRMVIEPLEGK